MCELWKLKLNSLGLILGNTRLPIEKEALIYHQEDWTDMATHIQSLGKPKT